MTTKTQSTRLPHQKKRAQKGKKSMRGQPEYYEEIKQRFTFSLTPTAKAGLNQLSESLSLSMSELIEQIGRGRIQLTEIDTSDST
jgi:hypothetical protein